MICYSNGTDGDDDNDDGLAADAVAADVVCQEWRTLWIDEAFWHLLFATDLLLVMIVCRPTINHCRSVIHRHSHIFTRTHSHITHCRQEALDS